MPVSWMNSRSKSAEAPQRSAPLGRANRGQASILVFSIRIIPRDQRELTFDVLLRRSILGCDKFGNVLKKQSEAEAQSLADLERETCRSFLACVGAGYLQLAANDVSLVMDEFRLDRLANTIDKTDTESTEYVFLLDLALTGTCTSASSRV